MASTTGEAYKIRSEGSEVLLVLAAVFRIRIRIDFALLNWICIRKTDPDPGAKKLPQTTNKPDLQPFKLDVPKQVWFMKGNT